ncbi:MAG: sensor domain-containing diguanylate cyclase [Bilophila sp.]
MKQNILARTNILVCTVIILGFCITSVISYRSNIGIFEKDVEHVSDLTSEGIYHRIDSLFTKPVNVSLTMANDSLLKDFLSEEKDHLNDSKSDSIFIDTMRQYLHAYREQYGYDSVFLVSTQTNRYYHFNGLDRTLVPGDAENVWYYTFLDSNDAYSLNIDNDQASQNDITVFINAKIKDRNGDVLGVVGVGFRVDSLQELLLEYEKTFSVKTWLVDKDGTIEVSTTQTAYEKTNLFATCPYPKLQQRILENLTNEQTFWYSCDKGNGYAITRYVPNLKWHLIVENDTTELTGQLKMQFVRGILVIIVIISIVLFVITSVIRTYNTQIIKLTVSKEKEHRTLFQEATEQLYEHIYELDITHNCASGENTEQYFESLGMDAHTPYDEALKHIAQKQIKEEYRQGYLDTFSPKHVLQTYENGIDRLTYDFLISFDNGATYSWMRIMGSIFFWNDDQSVRMIAYRQNINAQKQYEEQLFEQMQKDSLTGLYNKAATQEYIREKLLHNPEHEHAFFIIDIDNFKHVNDSLGHAMGDFVLAEFARILKEQFRDDDIVGRIGGDEFVVFLPVPHKEWVEKKAQKLVSTLHQHFVHEGKICEVSSSVGVALSPLHGMDFETLYKNADAALYETKRKGKNGFTIFTAPPQDPSTAS